MAWRAAIYNNSKTKSNHTLGNHSRSGQSHLADHNKESCKIYIESSSENVS